MAFEVLAPHLEAIEQGLADGKSPQAIAIALGNPGLATTIFRYKKKHFDLSVAARDAWGEEQKKAPSARFEEGKARIVDRFEALNLALLRGVQLLSLEIGTPYETAEGKKRSLSYGAASVYWQTGQRMVCDVNKSLQELSGDDPESRKADALEGLGESEIRALYCLLADSEEGGAKS